MKLGAVMATTYIAEMSTAWVTAEQLAEAEKQANERDKQYERNFRRMRKQGTLAWFGESY